MDRLYQRLTDPSNDSLWLRDELIPRMIVAEDGSSLVRPIAPPADAPPPRLGAVLVLLYQHHDEVYLPLTVRTAALRNHSGEVSLPGGSYDADDGDLSRTALREASEELAVQPETVTLWTQLSPVWIPVSNFQITPFVGWADQRPDFRSSPGEVAELIEVPLRLLLQPEVLQREQRIIRERQMDIGFFAVGQHKVWGATAAILAELVGKLRR